MSTLAIDSIRGRSILDSRGWPTVEVTLTLADGASFGGSAPAGASTGQNEAVELRDQGRAFSGRGVKKAVAHVNVEIDDLLRSRSWSTLRELDDALRDLDGGARYGRLGANAVVATSIAAARAFADQAGRPLRTWIAHETDSIELLPVPHFNVLNGGAHANNGLAFQEFMVAPVGAATEEHALQIGSEVYHALAGLVQQRFGSSGLGDEGGFAPAIGDPRMVLDLIVEAIAAAGYTPAVDQVAIALDPAANGFFLGDGRYDVNSLEIGRDGLIDYYVDLVGHYPIRSIEDGFAEDDLDGWTAMFTALGDRIQLVGDDLYVTDPARIREGAERGYSNAALIKPNQIGTVSETFDAIAAARENGMRCMISHRSGETADTFIADLAVGSGVGQIKSGAPARGERVAKYNRLAEIEADSPSLPYGLTPGGR